MIRGSRVPPPRRVDSATRPPSIARRGDGLNLVNFFIFHHRRVAIATRRKTWRSRDWPGQWGVATAETRRAGILDRRDLGAQTTGPSRSDESATQPAGFSISKDLETTAPVYPEINASTLNPAAPSMDPASGQALALRRWTNWVLFCFLNTHRCSGSILYFFYFFIFFLPPPSLSRALSPLRPPPSA